MKIPYEGPRFAKSTTNADGIRKDFETICQLQKELAYMTAWKDAAVKALKERDA